MDNTWLLGVESQVYTVIKAKTIETLKTAFPSIFYTTSNESTDKAVFPTVYIHQLNAKTYSDLDGSSVTGMMCNIEVVITTNTKKTDVKTIASEILQAFTDLKFHVKMQPVILTDANMFTCTMRFGRMLGQADKLVI